MSPPIIGFLGICLMLGLMAFGMPIGFAFVLAGFVGSAYLTNQGIALSVIGMVPWSTSMNYTLTTVPLFLLMGHLAFVSGISADLFTAAYRWIGRMPGGVAITTIGASAVFAACCGSSSAATAAMGAIAVPEMNRFNYSKKFSMATAAVGGTIAILIPPSITFIIYGMITEQSIGKLFIAGIIPGIVLSILYALVALIWVKVNPAIAPVSTMSFTWREKFTSITKVWGIAVLMFLVLGGIYFGWFTPTEAGAIGAIGALLVMFLKRQLTGTRLMQSLKDTGKTTCMIFMIIIGALIFQHFLASSGLPMALSKFILNVGVNPYLVLIAILILLAILGCVLDALSMILLTLPILFPLVVGVGWDPIWFGIIFTITVEMALITPPVGMNIFVISGMFPDVPILDVFRGVVPYLLALIATIIILVIFPQLALFLPNQMS